MKDNKNKSPEYIAISLLFYSFLICMIVFAIFRFCGIAWFSQTYIPFNTNIVIYYIASSILHIYEAFLIIKTLTNIKWYYGLIIAIIYDLLSYLILSLQVQFIADIIYTFSIPFIFNKDKDKSIKKSTIFMILIMLYQLVMSFSRYNMVFDGKYDLGYALLSIIDYRIFLLVIFIYTKKIKVIKEDINMDGHPNCFFFWGRFSEFCKLIGLIVLAIISTPLVLLTPFFLLAKYTYKQIPLQLKVFKEECQKKKAEKTK